MVLVDSTAPASVVTPGSSPGEDGHADLLDRVSALISIPARFGVSRLSNQWDWDTLPIRSRDEVRAGLSTASNLRSTVDEYVQANTSMQQAAALTDFGDKPLVVLTAGVGSSATHRAAQDHLATLSTNSVHRVIEGATHGALIADEEHAAATTRAILDVVTAVRSASPLIG